MKTALFVLLFLPVSLFAQTCASSSNSQPLGTDNGGPVPDAFVLFNAAEHKTGQHAAVTGVVPPGSATAPTSIYTNCVYTHAAARQTYCNVRCSVFNKVADTINPGAGLTAGDVGTFLGILPTEHTTAVAFKAAGANGTNEGTSCTGSFGGATSSCGLLNMNCQLNITVGDALSGKPSVGITNTNGSVIWSDSQALPNACAPILDPQYQGGTGGCTANPNNSLIQGPTGTLGVKVLDPSPDVPPPCSPVSPIIIDTEGEGFHLTSAENGVMFDMENSGHPLKLSWTERGSHNAFLVLDRDGSGKITSGKELFGDWTPQPRSPNPNGFLALAEFDKPENGGNSDGVIDDHDAVFSKLRLWIDENHDGVSQANELHTLPELGVYSLALRYVELRKTDRFGNEFRYRGLVNPGERRDRRDEVGRFAYDVFFVTE